MVERALDQRARSGDDRSVDPQRLDQRQGPAIAAAGRQHDANAGRGRSSQGSAHAGRQFVATVDERPVDVDGEHAVHVE